MTEPTTHQYTLTYLMPVWHRVTFEGPANMTQKQIIEHFETQQTDHGEPIFMDGEECGWSKDVDWWTDIISNGDYDMDEITNLTTDEELGTV